MNDFTKNIAQALFNQDKINDLLRKEKLYLFRHQVGLFEYCHIDIFSSLQMYYNIYILFLKITSFHFRIKWPTKNFLSNKAHSVITHVH